MGIFSLFKKTNSLYFPGCIDYYKEKKYFELTKKILTKIGINYKLIDKNICCGLIGIESGYDSVARKLARRNFEIYKEENINKIITFCPRCYKMFKFDYPNYLTEWNIEVVNIWKVILEKLRENNYKPKFEKEIGFQDSCYLGRYSQIFEEPREILNLIGYKITEFNDNRENSICSGSCGGLNIINQELSNKIAKERLLQAKRIGIKKLVVMSYEEFILLNRNSLEYGIEILLFIDILADYLGIDLKDYETKKINEQINNLIEEENDK